MLRAIGLVLLLAGVVSPAFAQNAIPINIPTVNSSTTIVTGSTFQTVLPAVAVNSHARRSLTIGNNNADPTAEVCWLFIGAGTATKAASIVLDAKHGLYYTRFFPAVPSDPIQMTCTTSNDTVYVDTQ